MLKDAVFTQNMFTQKVIIITGASQGIGFALAMALKPYGPKLVIAARNVDDLQNLKQQLDLPEQDVLIVKTDVALENDCKNLIDRAVKHFGRIDYLVNNAGISMWAMFDELADLSTFENIMQVNVMGSVYCTRYALPYLNKSEGTLVGMSSIAGLTGVPTCTAYAASKHALMGFYDSLRIEQMSSKLDIVVIAPDFVVSQIHKRSTDKDGKPLMVSPMQESKIMSGEDCAAFIINAVKNKKRLAIGSWRGKIGRWVKLIAPGLIDVIALKTINKKH